MCYYIRTLKENLDNILSSECISPYSFYSRRNFGYRRFERMGDAVSDSRLILESYIHKSDEDVVYIELSDSDPQLANIPKEETVYFERTIYLYPWNCRILFKDLEQARSSFFICRSSLMDKMWNCYNFDLVGDRSAIPSYNNVASSSLSDQGTVDNDNIHNRIKGFLFAYYIGVLKSLSPELALFQQAAMGLYGWSNALAGMRNPTPEMFKTIDNYKRALNNSDPNRVMLKQLWQQEVLDSFSSQEDGINFEALLQRLGVQRAAMDAFAAEKGIASSPRFDLLTASSMNWSHFKNQIDEYTRTVMGRELDKRTIDEKDMPIIDKSSVRMPSEQDVLYDSIVNGIISGNDWLSPQRVSSKRIDVANDVTLFVKSFFEKNNRVWEGSEEQQYFDAFRQNVAYSTPFNPNTIHDSTLRALAIFVMKGESVEDMVKYLQVAGVDNYSYVLGLWGANIGYADIPKTFINSTELSKDKVISCYISSYISMSGDRKEVQILPDGYKKLLERKDVEIRPVKENGQKNEEKDYASLLSSPVLKLTKAQRLAIESILEQNGGLLNEKGLRAIGEIKGIGKKKLEQIQILLQPITKYVKEVSLFADPVSNKTSSNEALTKERVWEIVESLLPEDENVRKQLKRDVEWFLQPYHLIDRVVLTKLCQYLAKNKQATGRRAWLRNIYKDVDVNTIENELIGLSLN